MTHEEIDRAIKLECKESQLFNAIIELLKEAEKEDADSLKNPELTDAGSHFNRGRLAASSYAVETLSAYLEE